MIDGVEVALATRELYALAPELFKKLFRETFADGAHLVEMEDKLLFTFYVAAQSRQAAVLALAIAEAGGFTSFEKGCVQKLVTKIAERE